MSSSQSTNLNTQQVNNDTARDNVVKNIVNSLSQQKDRILDEMNTEKTWVKINERVSVKIKRNTSIMDSTFRVD